MRRENIRIQGEGEKCNRLHIRFRDKREGGKIEDRGGSGFGPPTDDCIVEGKRRKVKGDRGRKNEKMGVR